MTENRRSGDGLILTMHGDIKEIKANQVNMQACVKGMCDRLEKHDSRIRSTEGSVTGIKTAVAAVVTLFSVAIGYLRVSK